MKQKNTPKQRSGTTYDLDSLIRDVSVLSKRCAEQEVQVSDLTRMTIKQSKTLNELRTILVKILEYRRVLAPMLIHDLQEALEEVDKILLKTSELHDFLIKQKE